MIKRRFTHTGLLTEASRVAATVLFILLAVVSLSAQKATGWITFNVPARDPDPKQFRKIYPSFTTLVVAPDKTVYAYDDEFRAGSVKLSLQSPSTVRAHILKKNTGNSNRVFIIKGTPLASYRDFVLLIRSLVDSRVKFYALSSLDEGERAKFDGPQSATVTTASPSLPDTISLSAYESALIFDFSGDVAQLSHKSAGRFDKLGSAPLSNLQALEPMIQKQLQANVGKRTRIYIVGDDATHFDAFMKTVNMLRKSSLYKYELMIK